MPLNSMITYGVSSSSRSAMTFTLLRSAPRYEPGCITRICPSSKGLEDILPVSLHVVRIPPRLASHVICDLTLLLVHRAALVSALPGADLRPALQSRSVVLLYQVRLMQASRQCRQCSPFAIIL